MLRHTGQRRSFLHDLRLAVLLSLSAGFINAAGFIAFQLLTTNVTGHAALLAVNIAQGDYALVQTAALWLLLFLAGAFSSGLIIARVGRDRTAAYVIPILIIMAVVLAVALLGASVREHVLYTRYMAGALLYAMGMQNALVSVISGAVVRTTHLTGMFTDLGIDLSAMVSGGERSQLRQSILLRVTIILSFLSGGVAGSLLFMSWQFSAFFVPAAILLAALFYDYFRIRLVRAVRRHQQ